MEPEVHIIEKYFQIMLKCFTMTNIRCKGNKEIDLLVINPRTGEKFHVESRIGTSPSFKIRLHDTYTKMGRPRKIGIDYFAKEKFDHAFVKERINEIFGNNPYRKWLVIWTAQEAEVMLEAEDKFGIEVFQLRDLINEMIEKIEVKGSRDDVVRIFELISQTLKEETSLQKTMDKVMKRRSPFKTKCPHCGYRTQIFVRETYERDGSEVNRTPILVSVDSVYCKKCKENVAKEGEIFKDGLSGKLVKKR